MSKDLSRHFFKEDIQMVNGTKRFSISLIMKEMQIKTAARQFLMLISMATTKKQCVSQDKTPKITSIEKGGGIRTSMYCYEECRIV